MYTEVKKPSSNFQFKKTPSSFATAYSAAKLLDNKSPLKSAEPLNTDIPDFNIKEEPSEDPASNEDELNKLIELCEDSNASNRILISRV
jgi:hypothetical protein